MKGLFTKKLLAGIIAILLVAGMSPAAFASYKVIDIDPTRIDIDVGQTRVLVIDYSGIREAEYSDEKQTNIQRAYATSANPDVATAMLGDNDMDIYSLVITGVADGETTVSVRVGKYFGRVAVTVGTGKKSSSSKTKTTGQTATSSKSTLEKALDSAIKKSTQKDVAISTTSTKTPAIASVTLKALAKSAEQANKRAIIRVDSLNSKGKLQARLYLDPSTLANLKSDFKTAVSLNTSRKTSIGSNYIASVKCAYTGGFSKYTEIEVKVNAPKDVSKLSFYNVDSKGNFKKIDKPSCSIDKNGVLHFFTKNGGEIVIINGTL